MVSLLSENEKYELNRDPSLDVAAISLTESDKSACLTVRWNSDGTFLAAGFGNGCCNIFSRDGNLHFSTRKDQDAAVVNVRWGLSLDTRASFLLENATGTVESWHAFEKRKINSMTEKANQLFALDLSNDGTSFATAGLDRTIRIYDYATMERLQSMEFNENTAGHQNRIFAVKFHPEDRNIIISGGWDNMIHVWDIRTSTSVRSWSGPHVAGDAMDIHKNVLVTGSGMLADDVLPVQTWDIGSGKCIHNISWGFVPGQLKEQVKVSSCSFSKKDKNGQYIVAASHERNEVRVFDTNTGDLLCRYGLPRASTRVFCIGPSPASTEMAVACSDGTIHVVSYVVDAVEEALVAAREGAED